MAFEKKVPEWKAEGVEPPESLKTSGWEAGYKPPASYFNWFMHGIGAAVNELQKKAAIADDLSEHVGNKENPHGITSSQIGAVSAQVFSEHRNDKENPHGVTAEQVGAATKKEFSSHAENKNNPHGVTADQIGAVSVKDMENFAQVFVAEYDKTTLAEVAAAYAAGKQILCKRDPYLYTLYATFSDEYYFYGVDINGTMYNISLASYGWNSDTVSHAQSHKSYGNDPLTPAMIGAAPEYTHGTEDIAEGSASPYKNGHLHFIFEP